MERHAFPTEALIKAECPICLGDYGDLQGNIPRILTCGHSYCSDCLEKFLCLRSRSVCCPRCRTRAPLGRFRDLHSRTDMVVANFLENFDLIPTLADNSSASTTTTTTTCKSLSSKRTSSLEDSSFNDEPLKPNSRQSNVQTLQLCNIQDQKVLNAIQAAGELTLKAKNLELKLSQVFLNSENFIGLMGKSRSALVFRQSPQFIQQLKEIMKEFEVETAAPRRSKKAKRADPTEFVSLAAPDGVQIRSFAWRGERFYLALTNGKCLVKGSDAFKEDLKPLLVPVDGKGGPKGTYYPEVVIFGPEEDSYFIGFENGMASWSNLPKSLHEMLIRKEKSGLHVRQIAIASDWSWFVQFSDHSVETKNVDDAFLDALKKIEDQVGTVKQVQFHGPSSNEFCVLYEKPAVSVTSRKSYRAARS